MRNFRLVGIGTLLPSYRAAPGRRAASGGSNPKPDNADTAAVLAAHGVAVEKLKRLYPRVLRYEPDRIRAMIAALTALRVVPAKVLNRNPSVWGVDPQCWEDRLAALRTLDLDAARVVAGCPCVLHRTPGAVRSKYGTLLRMGLDAAKVVRGCPTVFNLSDDRIGATIAFLDRAGLDGVRLVNNFPPVLCCNVDAKLRPVVHFITTTMGRDVMELQNCPRCFGYSLQKRISPRHAFAVLHQKQRRRLSSLFGTTDMQFAKMTGQPLAAFSDFVAQHVCK